MASCPACGHRPIRRRNGVRACRRCGVLPDVEPEQAVWRRYPIRDRRFRHGDDFAGDCWINDAGETRYTVVGFDLNAPENAAVALTGGV